MSYLTFSSDRTSKTSITTADMDHFLLKNSFLMKSHSRGLIDPKSPYFRPGWLHHKRWACFVVSLPSIVNTDEEVFVNVPLCLNSSLSYWQDIKQLEKLAMPDAGIMSAQQENEVTLLPLTAHLASSHSITSSNIKYLHQLWTFKLTCKLHTGLDIRSGNASLCPVKNLTLVWETWFPTLGNLVWGNNILMLSFYQ